MKRICLVIVAYACISLLFAQSTDSRDTDQLPSIVVRANIVDQENIILVSTHDNIRIPVLDLSRQFVKPGSYSLSYKQWGYHRYQTNFALDVNKEEIITINLTPVDSKQISRYNYSSKLNNISLISSLTALGLSGIFRVLGDSEYDKYNNATDTDEISKYRSSSNTYQIAFITSSSVLVSSALTWVISRKFKTSSKKLVINEMERQAP